MDHLDYGQFDSTNADIAFSAENLYTDPPSEEMTRKQLSYPLKEIKTFLHDAMPIDQNDKVVQLAVTGQNQLKYRTTAGSSSWTTVSGGIPSGGAKYQTIVKNSSANYDVAWGMPSYVGMVIMNTFSTEADVKAVYGSNTSWTKLSSVILASEHVFGNGYALGLSAGEGFYKGLGASQSNSVNRLWATNDAFGQNIPVTSGGYGKGDSPIGRSMGVPTKGQMDDIIEDDPDNRSYDATGLIADTETVYTWKRTA